MLKSLELAFTERRTDIESSAASSQCVLHEESELIRLDQCLTAIEQSMSSLREYIDLEQSALKQAEDFKRCLIEQATQTDLLLSLLPNCQPVAPRAQLPLQAVDIQPLEPATPRLRPRPTVSTTTKAPASVARPTSSGSENQPRAPATQQKVLKPPTSIRKAAPTVQQPFQLHKASSPAKPKTIPVEITVAVEQLDEDDIAAEESVVAAETTTRDDMFSGCIDDVSEVELRACPDYMRGRLDTLRVNDLVEKLRGILRRKYTILRLSPKKMNERQLSEYQAYIARETSVTRKQMWFDDVEIRQSGDIKIDNNLKNILMILRHLGRLKQDNKRMIVVRRVESASL